MTYRRPTVMVDGTQRLVSRVTMANHLRRELGSDELVHHINGDPFDNRIENLQLVTRSEHKRIHAEIGGQTRLKRQWLFNEPEILRRFETESARAIAMDFGCSEITIRRVVKKYHRSTDLRTTKARLKMKYRKRGRT